MKRQLLLFTALSLLIVIPAHADQTKTDVVERLDSSTKVLHQILNTPDKGIPDEVLKGAKCIAVVPNLLKGGFILAGQHGRGVATCRLPKGGWSAPAFFVISGGSWGPQVGVESIDLIMMVMTDEGMRHLMSDKFQIGGTASAALGPIGRHAAAGTDWKADTEILTSPAPKDSSLESIWAARSSNMTAIRPRLCTGEIKARLPCWTAKLRLLDRRVRSLPRYARPRASRPASSEAQSRAFI